MTACSVLARLHEIGAVLTKDGDRLVLQSGANPVPAEVLAAARGHKPALLRILASKDGPQSWARELARLDPGRPPTGVPLGRWKQLINDARLFLEDGRAAQAVDQGWGPYDLFGCDAAKPYARVDRLGLIWLLDGRPVAALTAEVAKISTVSGGHLTFHRGPIDPGQVLPWLLPANDLQISGCGNSGSEASAIEVRKYPLDEN